MDYLEEIHAAHVSPDRLEDLYQIARKSRSVETFRIALEDCAQDAPDNLLYQAWLVRLGRAADAESLQASRMSYWKIAIPLAILNGLILWGLSDMNLMILDLFPAILLLWAPITALLVMGFMSGITKSGYSRATIIGVSLLLAALYVILMARGQAKRYQEDYLLLMVIHLPMLAWIGTGLSILWRNSSIKEHFAFLIKSFEVFITAGVFVIAGGVFAGITIGLFEALSIYFSDIFMRLIFAGGGGLIPILAVAIAYDPSRTPGEQDFDQGLGRFLAIMMRLLLPLTLVVLVTYLLVIPANFREPFENRDVLIVYNLMLFAIMGLLIGATPIDIDELSPRIQRALRYGIILVATLAVLVSLYAMSATVYRTIEGGLTINRLTIIGWNSINIAILVLLTYRQLRCKGVAWADQLKKTFRVGSLGYAAWLLFTLVAIPIFFR